MEEEPMTGQQTLLSVHRPPADLSLPVEIDVWYYVPHSLLITDYETFKGSLPEAGRRALEWVRHWKGERQADELWPREIRHAIITNPGAPTGTFSTYSLAGLEQLVKGAIA